MVLKEAAAFNTHGNLVYKVVSIVQFKQQIKRTTAKLKLADVSVRMTIYYADTSTPTEASFIKETFGRSTLSLIVTSLQKEMA